MFTSSMTLISKWKFRWNKEAFDPSPAKIRGIGSRENAMEHIPYQLNIAKPQFPQ